MSPLSPGARGTARLALVCVLSLAILAALLGWQVLEWIGTGERLQGQVVLALRERLGVELRAAATELRLMPPGIVLRDSRLALPVGVTLNVDEVRIDLAEGTAFGALMGDAIDLRAVRMSGAAAIVESIAVPGLPVAPLLEGTLELVLTAREDGSVLASLRARLLDGGSFVGAAHGPTVADLIGQLEFQDVDVAPWARLLTRALVAEASGRGALPSLAGLFGGTAVFGDAPDRPLALHLRSPEAQLRLDELSASGPVSVSVALDRTRGRAAPLRSGPVDLGTFVVDASGARLEYAVGMSNVSGRNAVLRGRIVSRPGAAADRVLRLEGLSLSLEKLRARAIPVAAGPAEQADAR